VETQIQPARLISSVAPNYPAIARAQSVAGDVGIDAIIDAAGNVTDTKVLYGPALLSGSAVQALRLWKYEPARLNGIAVPTHLQVTIKFHRN
jgi:protein TonB